MASALLSAAFRFRGEGAGRQRVRIKAQQSNRGKHPAGSMGSSITPAPPAAGRKRPFRAAFATRASGRCHRLTATLMQSTKSYTWPFVRMCITNSASARTAYALPKDDFVRWRRSRWVPTQIALISVYSWRLTSHTYNPTPHRLRGAAKLTSRSCGCEATAPRVISSRSRTGRDSNTLWGPMTLVAT